ncbi:hypothetical protein TNCT_543821 [Trichonephila clavata]|uniref:Uncharacterized protein n=1 Tax=Trichonephila clavata TaxID=2740835 RepID=A0A8X6LP93_TRICU|nr:hypothetical protein TNCT_543821 [Trichonephila clavata]
MHTMASNYRFGFFGHVNGFYSEGRFVVVEAVLASIWMKESVVVTVDTTGHVYTPKDRETNSCVSQTIHGIPFPYPAEADFRSTFSTRNLVYDQKCRLLAPEIYYTARNPVTSTFLRDDLPHMSKRRRFRNVHLDRMPTHVSLELLETVDRDEQEYVSVLSPRNPEKG